MLKAIFLFIKAHAVATAITTTVVVGTAVAAPIAVNNYILDKEVKNNLSMLAPSNFQSESNSKEDKKPVVNKDEPLTFRIEKEYYKKEGGNIVKDMQGNDAIEATVEGRLYNIVPSYDKDYSKWTNEEKRAYLKAREEIARMEEERSKIIAEEANMNIQKMADSYSKEYSFTISKRRNDDI